MCLCHRIELHTETHTHMCCQYMLFHGLMEPLLRCSCQRAIMHTCGGTSWGAAAALTRAPPHQQHTPPSQRQQQQHPKKREGYASRTTFSTQTQSTGMQRVCQHIYMHRRLHSALQKVDVARFRRTQAVQCACICAVVWRKCTNIHSCAALCPGRHVSTLHSHIVSPQIHAASHHTHFHIAS